MLYIYVVFIFQHQYNLPPTQILLRTHILDAICCHKSAIMRLAFFTYYYCLYKTFRLLVILVRWLHFDQLSYIYYSICYVALSLISYYYVSCIYIIRIIFCILIILNGPIYCSDTHFDYTYTFHSYGCQL